MRFHKAPHIPKPPYPHTSTARSRPEATTAARARPTTTAKSPPRSNATGPRLCTWISNDLHPTTHLRQAEAYLEWPTTVKQPLLQRPPSCLRPPSLHSTTKLVSCEEKYLGIEGDSKVLNQVDLRLNEKKLVDAEVRAIEVDKIDDDDGLQDSSKIATFDFDGCLAKTSVKGVNTDTWSLVSHSIPEKLHNRYNDELQDAREDTVNGLKDKSIYSPMGVKRIGELDNKPFHVTIMRMFIEDVYIDFSIVGTPFWRLVLKQFDDLLVQILIVVAMVSFRLALANGETGSFSLETSVPGMQELRAYQADVATVLRNVELVRYTSLLGSQSYFELPVVFDLGVAKVDFDTCSTRETSYPCTVFSDKHPSTVSMTILVVEMLNNLSENQSLLIFDSDVQLHHRHSVQLKIEENGFTLSVDGVIFDLSAQELRARNLFDRQICFSYND
ncbi:hypothetical protein SASPL_115546 [Salvia splendens]|uniref:Uncharacterized protein n=1 Tax=Salvia splendens TaxID=180675 RepID=A0A8X8Y6R5_SALSN|nr:hypothetical protein SASPL_115546 [Salvia splendens]